MMKENENQAASPVAPAHGWNVEQILVYIWQCMSGEQSEREYPYETFTNSEMGQRLRIELKALAPVAMGETGQRELPDKWFTKFELDWHAKWCEQTKGTKPLRYDAKVAFLRALFQAGFDAAQPAGTPEQVRESHEIIQDLRNELALIFHNVLWKDLSQAGRERLAHILSRAEKALEATPPPREREAGK